MNDDVTSDSTLESDDEEYDVDSFARYILSRVTFHVMS